MRWWLLLKHRLFGTELVRINGFSDGARLFQLIPPERSGENPKAKWISMYWFSLFSNGKAFLFYGEQLDSIRQWEPYTYSPTLQINKKAKRKEQLRRILSSIRRALNVEVVIILLFMMTVALGALGVIIGLVEILKHFHLIK